MVYKAHKVNSLSDVDVKDLTPGDHILVHDEDKMPLVALYTYSIDDIFHEFQTSFIHVAPKAYGAGVLTRNCFGYIPSVSLPNGLLYADTFVEDGNKVLNEIRPNLGSIDTWRQKSYAGMYKKNGYMCTNESLGKLAFDLISNFKDVYESENKLNKYLCFEYKNNLGYFVIALEQNINNDTRTWHIAKKCYYINKTLAIKEVYLSMDRFTEYAFDNLMSDNQKDYYTKFWDSVHCISDTPFVVDQTKEAVKFLNLGDNSISNFVNPTFSHDGKDCYVTNILSNPAITFMTHGKPEKILCNSKYSLLCTFAYSKGQEGFNPFDGEYYSNGKILHIAGYWKTEYGIKVENDTFDIECEYYALKDGYYRPVADENLRTKIDGVADLVETLMK